MPLTRIDSKHFRRFAEIVSDGSRIVYRAGTGALHRAPDGISRHPENMGELLRARMAEWGLHDGGIEQLQRRTGMRRACRTGIAAARASCLEEALYVEVHVRAAPVGACRAHWWVAA